MPKAIEFHFDFISPYSYLAHVALPQLAAEHAATIRYFPFNLVELMKVVGNRPTTLECKNKGQYVMRDVQRWTAHYAVKFSPNPNWANVDFAELGRGALVAIDEGRGTDYIAAIFAAHWQEAADLAQRSVLLSVLDKAGFDATRLLARAGSPEYVAKLDLGTRTAAERGAFGSPTIFIGQEMFFGNDRFDFVAAALRSPA
jgi:2-hydroxychromene-2-carboxylate isomerase